MLTTVLSCNTDTAENTGSLTVEVDHYKVPCVAEGIQLCYRISMHKGGFENFYDEIAGFKYEWGYVYTIELNVTKEKNPRQDGSGLRYSLKKIIKKQLTGKDVHFELPLVFNNEVMIKQQGDSCSYFDAIGIGFEELNCESIKKYSTGIFKHAADHSIILVGVKK